jgi:phosphatidylserine decarboxylase
MLEDLKRTFGEVFGWVATIHPRGKATAAITFFCALILFAASYFLCSGLNFWLGIIYVLLGVFVAFFFRDPVRNTLFTEQEIACPADGKVLSVKTEEDPDVLVIRIFLSVFNVHIQRITMTGKVTDVKYTKGSFAFANNPNANNNERNLIKIENEGRFAHMEQITGAVARRIEAWVKPGQEVKAGQYAGMIYFGSQVAVYLPKDKVRVVVKEGQSVQGALDVLALWKQSL